MSNQKIRRGAVFDTGCTKWTIVPCQTSMDSDEKLFYLVQKYVLNTNIYYSINTQTREFVTMLENSPKCSRICQNAREYSRNETKLTFPFNFVPQQFKLCLISNEPTHNAARISYLKFLYNLVQSILKTTP